MASTVEPLILPPLMAGHLAYSSCSFWPRLHSYSGLLYFRNPCYAATSLLRITAITSPPTKQN